jgi:hypothetical protein
MKNEAEAQLSLKYTGEAVDLGRLGVYEAAATMLAFSDFVTQSAKVVYGSQTELRAQVAGFRGGSFATDILFQVAGPLMPLLAEVTVSEWLKTIKTAFELWKHLKGEPPSAVATKGDEIQVTNNSGRVIIVNRPSLELVMDERAAAAVARFVGEQLLRPGLDDVQILRGKEAIASASRGEAEYFKPVLASVPVSQNEFDYVLTIEAPVFKEGKKWRFSDGSTSFHADIEDAEFLQRVDAGEAFAKGDQLRVRLRIEQMRHGRELSATRTVVQVLEHIRQRETGTLFGGA